MNIYEKCPVLEIGKPVMHTMDTGHTDIIRKIQ